MNKLLLSTLTAAMLLGVGIASEAQQVVTYQLTTGDTPFTTGFGITGTNTSPPSATATYDASLTNLLEADLPNPNTVTTPSVLKYGDDFTFPGLGTPDTFSNFAAVPISFNFQLDAASSITGTAHSFTATGTLDGSVGYGPSGAPFSTAHIFITSLEDDTTGQFAVLGMDPNNTAAAFGITSTINGASVDLYLDEITSKPQPGQTLSIAGFVRSSVPEPGSVAMLIGMGVSGSAFLFRKRNRK